MLQLLRQLSAVLRWPLAALTILLVGTATVAAPLVVGSRGDGGTSTNLYVVAAIYFVGSTALMWWHRHNLTEYLISPEPRWIDILAHIGGTALVFFGGFAATFGLVISIGQLLGLGEDGLKFCVAGTMIVILPLGYYSGRLVADLLSGDWSDKVVAEIDERSPHHPVNRFRPEAFTTEIPADHWISFCLTGVPVALGLCSGFFVYHFAASIAQKGSP